MSGTAIVIAITLGLCAATPQGAAGRPQQEPPKALRIIATIDGVDELRISHREAVWTHRAWAWPTEVQINGQNWDPELKASMSADESRPFLREGIPLAGATLWKIRGRGRTELGWTADGLVIRFDDEGPVGADVYEVLITFADARCEASTRFFKERDNGVHALEVDVKANVDGADAVVLSSLGASWKHYDAQWPTAVRLNDEPWQVLETPTLAAKERSAIPSFADLSGAELVEKDGREIVQLDASAREVVIRLDDRASWGAADYHALVRLPIEPLARVSVECDEAAEGARLTVLRYPADGGDPIQVSGQRVVGRGGRAFVALPPGDYRFAVQHRVQAGAMTRLIALKSGRVTVDSAQTLKLGGIRMATPRLEIAGHGTFDIEEIGLRSILPVGDVRWRRSTLADTLELVVSRGQSYRIRVLAKSGATHAAVWMNVPATELTRLKLDADQLTTCGFTWRPDTVAHTETGVSLVFPDATRDLQLAADSKLLTNRRFFEMGYWLRVKGGGKVVFHPRGYVVPRPPGKETIMLGGALQGRATAAILTNEKLGRPDAKQLWSEVSVQDPSGHVMNAGESEVDWQVSVRKTDGAPMPAEPFSMTAIEELGELRDTVRFAVAYRFPEPITLALSPEAFVAASWRRVSTTVPARMPWRSTAYLAKVERSLQFIGSVRGQPVDPGYRLSLKWWLNSGAVGGHGGFTMPINGMSEDFSWYTHPWAISHELLHGFGYGHSDDMDRVDLLVQECFRQFRWYVADNPQFVPEALRE